MTTLTRVHNAKELGDMVRKARKEIAGLRQREAAFLCGVSPPFFNKLENGGEGCRLGMVLSICDQLGIQVHLRLPGGDDE